MLRKKRPKQSQIKPEKLRLNPIGVSWSSHTWCKAARDSSELRKEYFGDLLPDSEDRVFGALVLGKYPEGKKYRSTRTEMSTKVVFRK